MDVERPRYFDGQFLGAADLTAAIQYSTDRDARHMLGAHAWGIAAGLQLQNVTHPDGSVSAFIRPGYAWDGFGRPVVVLAPYQIPQSLFVAIAYDPTQPQGQLIRVWLAYDELETQPPQPGFGSCDGTDQNARIVETFHVEIGERPNFSDQRDPITVAGQSIDAADAYDNFVSTDTPIADASVPFQALPDDGAMSKWLIPLGYVRWLPSAVAGQAGGFTGFIGDDEKKSRSLRRYIGAVCENLLACDGFVRVANRMQNDIAAANRGEDLLRVEGGLRAQGDIRSWGTTLDFRDPNGDDNGLPLTFRRTDNITTGRTLDLSLGLNGGASTTRFGIGTLNAANGAVTENFVVLSNGSIGVGTTTPAEHITVQGTGGTFINVKDDNVELRLGANPTGGILSTKSNDDLLLRSNDANRMAIKADGKVGINTIAPSQQLHVVGDRIRLESGDQKKHIELCTDGPNTEVHSKAGSINLHSDAPAGNNYVLINSGGLDGSVGIGTTAPTRKLTVAAETLLLSDGNPLLFDSFHQGFPNGVANKAEISNDTGIYKGLMIVGNRSAGDTWAGLGRKVIVYDILEVRGNQRIMAVNGGGDLDVAKDAAVHGDLVADGTFSLGGQANLQGDLGVSGSATVQGSITYWGSLIHFSDERLKHKVKPIESPLERLLQLRGVSYETKGVPELPIVPGKRMGFIAQEVERVFPEWVNTGQSGYKQLRTDEFNAVIVEAMRELREENQKLRARVEALEKKGKSGSARS